MKPTQFLRTSQKLKGPTLVIVDANHVMRACFYAMDVLTYKKQETHAIKGLLNRTRQVCSRFGATHCAIAFDGSSPTFRHLLYPEYKSGRKANWDAKKKASEKRFNTQPALARELMAKLGYCVMFQDVVMSGSKVKSPSVEADDWIGSLARKFAAKGGNVVIASGDKDFSQEVTDKIRLCQDPKHPLMGPKEVEAKYKVRPERFVDFLALVGDGVDSIPGVPGIGPTTALKLIAKYPSLSRMWANRKKLKGLETNIGKVSKEHLKLMKTLVTIVDVPGTPSIKQTRLPPAVKKLPAEQRAALEEFNTKKLGFKL